MLSSGNAAQRRAWFLVNIGANLRCLAVLSQQHVTLWEHESYFLQRPFHMRARHNPCKGVTSGEANPIAGPSASSRTRSPSVVKALGETTHVTPKLQERPLE